MTAETTAIALLSTEDAADRLGVTVAELERLAERREDDALRQSGPVPTYTPEGVFYTLESLAEYRARNAPSSAPAPRSTTGKCPNCGDTIEAGGRGRGRVFCRTKCRELWKTRAKSEGYPLLPYVLAWTETRHAKPGTREAEICRQARSEITAIAREFLNQRKADGMPPVADYVETLLRDGERYMDRRTRS